MIIDVTEKATNPDSKQWKVKKKRFFKLNYYKSVKTHK